MTLQRMVLLGLAMWLAIATLSNLCDALVAMHLAAQLNFASGNYADVVATVAKIDLPAWGAAILFALAILLEALASGAFVRAFLEPSSGRIHTAFALALLIFGGFVVIDDLCRAYGLEGTHRGIVVFIAALYVVVQVSGAPRLRSG